MKKLKAALPPNAQLVYLPASWNEAENWPLFQRAYLTAQSLGVADKAHDAMYDAIWTTGELGVTDPTPAASRPTLPSIEDAARFYQRVTGVKAADFVTRRSPSAWISRCARPTARSSPCRSPARPRWW